jgi:hypothetical protein
MDEERKKILQYALQYDIVDVHTYSGYKGGLIVKITTRNANTVDAIESYALSLSTVKEVAVKKNHLMQFEIFCVTKDNDVYELKVKSK